MVSINTHILTFLPPTVCLGFSRCRDVGRTSKSESLTLSYLFPLTSPLVLGTGELSEAELSIGLVSIDKGLSELKVIRRLIRMFDEDKSDTINFTEFCVMWALLGQWRTLFDRVDSDGSGNLSVAEFSDALVGFSNRLSSKFVDLFFHTFEFRHRGFLSFDIFVHACLVLQQESEIFKRHDEDRDGYITLSFEGFVSEIFGNSS